MQKHVSYFLSRKEVVCAFLLIALKDIVHMHEYASRSANFDRILR